MHTYGTCVQEVGIGCFMNFPAGHPLGTYNATGYSGIQFYAMGTASALKVVAQNPATESTTYGGQCTLAVLSCTANSAPVLGAVGQSMELDHDPLLVSVRRHRSIQRDRAVEH